MTLRFGRWLSGWASGCALGAALIFAPGASGQIELSARGASLRVGGQIDLHASASSTDVPDLFSIRRAWLIVDVTHDEFLSGRFITDMATSTVFDASVRFAFHPAFALSFGRFKRSFDLFELESIADYLFLERSGRVPGYSGCTGVGSICSYTSLTQRLLLVNRDTGLRVDGRIGSLGYTASLTNGTRFGATDENDGKSTATRVWVQLSEGLQVGMNGSYKDYVDPSGATRYARVWGPDFEFGTYRDGLLIQAGVLTGDNWQSQTGGVVGATEPGRFITGQLQASIHLPTDGGRIEGVAPMLRVSLSDPDDNVDDDGGVLLTQGIAAYLHERTRITLNLDWYAPATGDPVWSFRMGTLLYF